jgi:hypothetical protein
MSWTTQMEEVLRADIAEGYSYGEIAQRLKVSRNADAGKCHRLGLTAADKPAQPVAKPKPRIKCPDCAELEERVGILELAVRGRRIAA